MSISVGHRLAVFQSTLPHGSDRLSFRALNCPAIFQSTLPHGSDQVKQGNYPAYNVISIHAPSRERPAIPMAFVSIALLFQSTLPHGSDRDFRVMLGRPEPISIHAPSRERPLMSHSRRNKSQNFNPRSLTGATPKTE